MSRKLWFFVVLALAGLAAAACSSGGDGDGEDAAENTDTAPGAELTQTAEAGGITVDATWLTAENAGEVDADLGAYPGDRFIAIGIAFTTHSGDLGEIDMEEAASLQVGENQATPEAWVTVSDDSHHREGVLVFARSVEEGPAHLFVEVGEDSLTFVWESVPGA